MKIEGLTFEQLPEAVSYLITKVESLEQILQTKDECLVQQAEQWFNINELMDYLPDNPKKATVYSWVNKKTIPYYKSGKKLQFLKSEIDTWLLSGKRKSEQELQREAVEYLNKRKGGTRYE